MAKKTTFNGGTIDKYESSLKNCMANEESFTTVSSGLSRKIVFTNGMKLRYFGSQNNNQLIEGAFLVQMVQRDVDKYIANLGIPKFEKTPDVQQFNIAKIKNSIKSDKPLAVIGIDINACYWNVAYKLGYISESLYERGLNLGKKKGLLISIGCLNKLPIIKKYEYGVLIEKTYDYQFHNQYSPFYWNILAYTHDLMMESYGLFREDWYMFLTDCIFVDYKRRKDIQSFLESKGFKFKMHQIHFKSFENGKLDWFDFKDQSDKSIYAMNRDIEMTYPLWKISKQQKYGIKNK
jgi:hypothetical protein